MAFKFLDREDEDDEEADEADEQQEDEDVDDLVCVGMFIKLTTWESISFRLLTWDVVRTAAWAELVSLGKLECEDDGDSLKHDVFNGSIASFASKIRLGWVFCDEIDGCVKFETVVPIAADDDEETTSSELAVEISAGVELFKFVNSIIVSLALVDWSWEATWGCWSCTWACGCTDFLLDSMVMTESFS